MFAPQLRLGMDEAQLARLFDVEREMGLRFELTETGLTWEASPGIDHQRLIYQIERSLDELQTPSKPCGCHHVSDVAIVLADGMVKRPDISIWCEWPKEREGFVHEVPEAVVEIVSPGYEAKDLVHGPPSYLRNGIKDVIVFDRTKGEVHHWTSKGHRIVVSPAALELTCGGRIVV